VADTTVTFRPFGDLALDVTGSDKDVGVIGELTRSAGEYEPELVHFLRRALPDDGVVVDGGAHIGVLTLLAASLCPRGTVYAFEPAPATADYLEGNVRANGLANVVVERAVLGAVDGEVGFQFEPDYPAGSHVGDAPAVRAVRLDTWAGEHGLDRIDLVKLDLEGAEIAAIEGGARTLTDLRPIVVVECNPVALRRFTRSSYADLDRRLRDRFPLVGALGRHGRVVPVPDLDALRVLLRRRGVLDLVGLPAERLDLAVRGRLRAARARRRIGGAGDPGDEMVIDPEIDLEVGEQRVVGAPGEARAVSLEIRNRTGTKLTSDSRYHAVRVAGCLVPAAATDSPPGDLPPWDLPAPVPPGRGVAMRVGFDLPAEPGDYVLELRLVQDSYVRLDWLDPDRVARVPVRVEGRGPGGS
jgi:FkbM family methyltransferase